MSILGPLIPVFWTSGDVSPGFQSQFQLFSYKHLCTVPFGMQGLFADCIYVGSGDPVRVLPVRVLHNKYAGYN